jgi:hypothetical protein
MTPSAMSINGGRMWRTVTASIAVFAGCIGAPTVATAQDTYANHCANFASPQGRGFCERIGQAIEIAQPRIGIALSGGNPVPGTASTLGMRLGSIPRISAGLRAEAAFTDLPQIESADPEGSLKFAATSLDADVSVGVFSGLSVIPTIGGLGSVDILASAGLLALPGGKGFSDDKPKSWAVGARVGILRESFTAPGISVSGMYRRTGNITYGDSTLATTDSYFSVDDLTAWSYRAAISKRIPLIGFGATAGVGIDRYNASSSIAFQDPAIPGVVARRISTADMKQTRKSAFLNASWTLLVLNVAGEIGWQEGGKTRAFTTIPTDKLEKAGYFAGVAVRIAL